METYYNKNIASSKCTRKSLITSSPRVKYPDCEHLIDSKENTKRAQSEKKPKKPFQERKSEIKKIKKPEEEKKLSLKKTFAEKTRKPTKKPTKSINFPTRPKAKNPVPCKKRGKKKPTENPKTHKKPLVNSHPTQRQYQEFYSDSNNLFDEAFFSDSFERENSGDYPVFGFNPVYLPTHGYLLEENYERPILNRVSNNLLNLFFDNIPGFTEVEFAPVGDFRSDSRTFSIAEILNHLVSLHPERATPANPIAVSQIPSVIMSQGLLKDNSTCAICQEDYDVGETLKKLQCGHIYHENCLKPWFRVKDTCPVCRVPFHIS
ncbi:hypothetical protein SteCoe_6253 [Stentor coeruleus]|uniref:RING-type domain-containing protein n=1 Tax=Stentor coeruleus TaxID=5963 RepID=A0A1R2CQJ1_9CILI|nr:hypothetical protein SteCoe_6253 [Stentor coeruleus]